jgi:hypothetical protein
MVLVRSRAVIMARRRTFAAAAFAIIAVVIVGCAARFHPHLATPPGTDPDALQVNSYQVNHGPQTVWLTFHDKDYDAVEPIVPVMDAEFQRQAHATQPVAARLGGRVKIVLPTSLKGVTIFNFDDPENTKLAVRANQEFALAFARGNVEAIRISNLFDSVTVETADIADVPVEGYDVVLWKPAATPWAWRYRIAGKSDAFTLTIPLKVKIAQFAEVVGDNIRQSKATH